jgi:hypothetical protein
VQKQLWLATQRPEHLAAAIRYYGRGFEVRKDYYNGENYALCLDYRAALQQDPNERMFDHMSARKVREQLREIVGEIIASSTFAERSDVRWVLATAANSAFALGHDDEGKAFEQRFMASKPADWEVESYHKNLAEKLRLARS